ncbi:hypothetical protein D3C73_1562280 [compost metagenome]
MVIAREGPQKSVGIEILLDRENSQPQAGSPSLGARLQLGDLVRGKLKIHQLVKQVFGLRYGKFQIGSAKLR